MVTEKELTERREIGSGKGVKKKKNGKSEWNKKKNRKKVKQQEQEEKERKEVSRNESHLACHGFCNC